MTERLERHATLLAVIGGAILLLLYAAIFGGFFPNASGGLGHDYSYFLPQLASGVAWYLVNGLPETPWYTPAFCGGVPYFANPQGMYNSVPQFLSFWMDPVEAVRLSLLLFAAIGYAGMYVLLRRIFKVPFAVAFLGGALFALNGFLAYRVIVGHLTFHSFALAPLIAFCLIAPVASEKRRDMLMYVPVAALLTAYVFYAGGVHLLVPIYLATLVIGLLYVAESGRRLSLLLSAMVMAGVTALLLAAFKLSASMAFTAQFPRDMYRLPGTATLLDAYALAIKSLFVSAPAEHFERALVNADFRLNQHEIEYSIGLAPLLVLAAAAWAWGYARFGKQVGKQGKRRSRRAKEPETSWRPSHRAIAYGVAIALLLQVPVLVNWYQPTWNQLLKSLPLTGESSSLFRWFAAFIPVVIVLCCVALARVPLSPKVTTALALGAVVVTLVFHGTTDKSFYSEQAYDSADLRASLGEMRAGTRPIGITEVGAIIDEESGQIVVGRGYDEMFLSGQSGLFCWEPMFGYQLERYPREPLRPGPVDVLSGGAYNLKNPACYLFPDENDCVPGDHYRIDQKDELRAFAAFQPVRFEQSSRQRAAGPVSAISLIVVFLALGAGVALTVRAIRRERDT